MKCSICKGEIEKLYVDGEMVWDKGNNAEPITSGRCCHKCNEIVVSARITQYEFFKRREGGAK